MRYQMPYQVPAADDRDHHDGGEAANASHFFSRKTMKRANGYRDVSWGRIGRQGIFASALILASRIPGIGDMGPFLLLIGAGVAVFTAFVAIQKYRKRKKQR